jgi:hypothetical protein
MNGDWFNEDTKFSQWVADAVYSRASSGQDIDEIIAGTGFDRHVVECLVARWKLLPVKVEIKAKLPANIILIKNIKHTGPKSRPKKCSVDPYPNSLRTAWAFWDTTERCLERFHYISPALLRKTISDPPTEAVPGAFLIKHPDCYLKEARAIIRGKHWEGKNRCVKLPGDEDTPGPIQSQSPSLLSSHMQNTI